MKEKVWKYMREHHMVSEGDRIIVGVSGGADSVALFCLLEEFRRRINFEICVVHVNHGLRGEEARRDAHFVEKLCREKGVSFFLCSCDVGRVARERKISIEEAGRQVRGEAFAQHMQKWRGNKLALAHHAGDLAETMLHHLCRGTGIIGLCGILPVQDEKIRPLLCLERKEIVHYLESNQIAYVHDSTNDSDLYTRNRIRHQVLPVLEAQVNSQTVRHMAAAAEKLREISGYLEKQARGILLRCGGEEDGKAILWESFFEEEPILQEFAALMWIEQVCGGRRDVADCHVKQFLALFGKPVGKRIELPGGFRVVRRYDGVILEKDSQELDICKSECCDLPIGGEIRWGDGRIVTRVFPYIGQEISEKKYTKWLNYDKINLILQVRNRRPGDYLAVASGSRKKLRDYLIDSKVPRDVRDRIPLVASGQEILWVIGYRMSETCKVEKDTKTVLEIQFFPEYEGGEANV